jgi:hypothetical protein
MSAEPLEAAEMAAEMASRRRAFALGLRRLVRRGEAELRRERHEVRRRETADVCAAIAETLHEYDAWRANQT